jgi:hypothetical protein
MKTEEETLKTKKTSRRKRTPKAAVVSAEKSKISAGEAVSKKLESVKTAGLKNVRSFLAGAVRQTFFAAGYLTSRIRRVKDIPQAVKWDELSSNTKTILETTGQKVTQLGKTLKDAVPVEAIAGGTQKILTAAQREAGKVGNGTAKKLSQIGGSLQRGAVKAGRGTKKGLGQIGGSFREGYDSFQTVKKTGRKKSAAAASSSRAKSSAPATPKPRYVVKKKILADAVPQKIEAPKPEELGERKPEENAAALGEPLPSVENKTEVPAFPATEGKGIVENVTDANLESEVDKIVGEIAAV